VIGRERGRSLGVAVALLAALCWLAAGGSAKAGLATYELHRIGNFKNPVHVDNAPGANNLLFVVGQKGTIHVLKNEKKVKRPFLNIRDRVRFGGEEGLFSVAFHPGYAENRAFYVYYTNLAGDVQIDQFKRKKSRRAQASEGSRKRVIKIPHDQASNHNGGQLQFGPDGLLYAGIGDGGPQGDPENDAQSSDTLLGKLIRIQPALSGGYGIPDDNPFVGQEGEDEIFALGLRNPWRFSFDSETGALTIGDVGGSQFEEINYVPGPDAGLGANFGWNDYEGFAETQFGIGPNADPHTEPIADFSHDAPDDFCSIAGGYVVRDPGLPTLEGDYVFSDLCDNKIRAIEVPSGASIGGLGVSLDSPVGFGEGVDGQIYVADLTGPVYRLEETAR
jgi:glucose/arabinose dehydrogenase